MLRLCISVVALMLLLSVTSLHAADVPTHAAAVFRKAEQSVEPINDTTILAEAEEFRVTDPGWRARPWGENYYCATFANAFLSRKAFLGAPEQGARTTATLDVRVPKAGKYLVLVRYEATYRFETQFRVQVAQDGKQVLDRLYGARDNVKIWAFSQKLKTEVAWSWGAGENVVWEGHDAAVQLAEGTARLTLVADKQPEPAARRNVDLVMLTSDEEQVKMRIDKEKYLPLDGMLTQAGDVFIKVHNQGDGAALTLTLPHCTEHSPYWVHLRTWKPKTINAKPGETTDWIEAGSLLDTLNDGQWNLTAKGSAALHYHLEVGVKNAAGKIESLRRFDDLKGDVSLAYSSDTRYSRKIGLTEEVLYDLVAYLKKHPIEGKPLKKTLVYGYTFDPRPGNEKYTKARDEFIALMGGTAIGSKSRGSENQTDDGLIRGYIDVRSTPTAKLEEYCKNLKEPLKIAVVSLGDEIGLAKPPAAGHAAFRDWLKTQKVKPSDLDPQWGDDWDKVMYAPNEAAAKGNTAIHYYSQIYAYRFGIRNLKERTDILRKHLPNAGIGANFSPHHGSMYLGETHHWISLFREDGMTMPWGEDYIWQVPVGSQQMNSLMVDMFRAGVKDRPDAKIHYYVMPHAPNNTLASWRRQFYGTVGHGAKVLNLFEFRPVQAAYTENHVSDPAMYQEVRRGLHELARFEDIVQAGRVRPAEVGLWCSEAADVWHDYKPPFDAHKRTLYIAIRQQQLPLDIVVEGDDLKSYKALYLTDAHVSRAASKVIADWVKGGGHLFATAGAGRFDEFNQPNKMLAELFGIEHVGMDESKEPVRFEKQDLPFAEALDTLQAKGRMEPVPVFGARSNIKVKEGDVFATFTKSGLPAATQRKVGAGEVVYCAFLPGLTYFQTALPKRPMDRGATNDSLTHFIPTDFHPWANYVVALPSKGVKRPVTCSERLVESTIIESKEGVVIPLINWSKGPVKGLTVTVSLPVPAKTVTLASGKEVKMSKNDGTVVLTLDLDVADALILRP